MNSWIPLLLVANLAQAGFGASLQLKNRIVFTRDDKTKQNETVWTMNSDGKEQKRVWRVPNGYGQFGGFNQDGRKGLSFDRYHIYIHDLQTQRIHQLLVWTNGIGSFIRQPSFSPDGKQVLCVVGTSNQNASNTTALRLQTNKSYSAAGRLETQKLRPVGEGVPDNNLWDGARWSSDGKKIVAVGGPSYSFGDYYSRASPGPTSQIWMMNSDGTGAHQLTHNSAWNVEPDWSRDGRKVIFVRRLKTSDSDLGVYSSNLVLLDTTTEMEKDVTALPEKFDDLVESQIPPVVSKPLFSPDGSQIAFEEITNAGQNIGIYRIDVDGKNQKRLSDGQLVQWVR